MKQQIKKKIQNLIYNFEKEEEYPIFLYHENKNTIIQLYPYDLPLQKTKEKFYNLFLEFADDIDKEDNKIIIKK